MPRDPSRKFFLDLCDRALVPQERWHDRDSEGAQRQVGEARQLLLAGCPFKVIRQDEFTQSDIWTWWLEITSKGFNYFEEGILNKSTFYIPTNRSLKRAAGGDWY